MFNNKFRSRVLTVFILSAAVLDLSASSLSAQEASKIAVHIGNSDVQVSNYEKISATLAGVPVFHVVGAKTVFELREKDRAVHRLHADDIKINRSGNRSNGEFSGNIHYTMTHSLSGAKLIDGTAERALYRQPDAGLIDGIADHVPSKQIEAKQPAAKDDPGVTLIQAHISLFREGSEVADLQAGKIVANLQDDIVTGTGAVHISAHITGQHAEITAEKMTWNRRTNNLEASGKVHVSYTGIHKNDGVLDADRINIDLKNLEIQVE
jgi:hypothetical protein